MTRYFKKITRRLTALLLVLFLAGGGIVYAFVNEAISMAFEAATPYVEQGFEVREDTWSGEVEPGKPLLVRHQLFRGNEYWFWAGTSWPGATVKVDIFDSEGQSVKLEGFVKPPPKKDEEFSEGSYAGVRTLPGKTATYFIRVIVEYDHEAAAKDPKLQGFNPAVDGVGEFTGTVDWGLAYGYR
ncbi:hypothetical protein VSU19_07015 [Verrucomicrobiales bacterium BCK34]|nr:hypothetical protein [Verrucomicrobiales bacterium BCK34]